MRPFFTTPLLRIFCIGFILCLATGVSQSQTLNVVENDGSQTDFTIENLRKLCFSDGDMMVVMRDNSESIFDLTGMRKLMFSDFGSSIEEQDFRTQGVLSIYPNPATDVVYVDLTNLDSSAAEGVIQVLTLQAMVVINQRVTQSGLIPLEVSHLLPGIYLCRFVNSDGAKAVKIIKQ